MKVFAERLKEIRVEKGMTQGEVATALNITRSAYTNYELGIREPSYEMLRQLCTVLEVSADYLIGVVDSY